MNESWPRIAFGDVVKLSRERSKNPEKDGFERFVGLEHIDPGDLKIRRWADIADGTTFTSVFRPGQVLFGKRRSYQGKVALADFSGVCSGDIYVFEPNSSSLFPELLPFICQTVGFFEHAVSTSAGSLSPRTNWESLANYEFALPSLEEQRRLASLLTAIERLLAAFDRLALSFDLIREATIEYPPHLSRSYQPVEELRLESITSLITDGDHNPPRRVPLGVPHVLVQNVHEGRINLGECAHISEGDFERVSKRYAPRRGDVLVACVGTIGRAGVVGAEERFSTDRSLAVIRFDESKVLQPYGFALLTSQSVQRQIQNLSLGSAQPHLYLGDIRRIRLRIPDKAVQVRVLESLNRLAAVQASTKSRRDALIQLKSVCLSTFLESQPLRSKDC